MINRRLGYRLGSLVFAMALSLIGCGGSAPPPEQPAESTQVVPPPSAEPVTGAPSASAQAAQPSAPAPDNTGSSASAASPSDPKVTLLSPGKDPKVELRYTPKANQTTKMTVLMSMGLTVRMGDKAQPPMKLPKMSTDMTMQVTGVAPDGAISYDFAIVSAKALPGKDVKPELMKQLDASFGKMVGLKGHAVVDSRGITRELTMDVPAGLDPSVTQLLDSMRQSMREMSNPLPLEPVGVGAKWDTEQRVVAQGMTIRQVTHSTLTKHQGTKITLDLEVEQAAGKQPIALPGAAASGAKATLLGLKSTGKGSVDGDLSRIAPLKSHLDLDSHTEVSVAPDGAEPVTAATDLTMNMEFKSK